MISFMLLDILPFIVDMLVPIFLIGYGIHMGSVCVFICGCLYLYAVWSPILAEGGNDEAMRK